MKRRIICLFVSMTILFGTIFSLNVPISAEVISSNSKLPFTDVADGSWYNDGALFCYVNSIIQGQGNSYTFAPDVNVTRATFVVMLARVAKADVSGYTESRFTDCTASWYIPSIEWAAENGYVNGTGEGRFSPDKTMTRQEMAALITRFMKAQNYNVTIEDGIIDRYSDKNKISDWALEGMEYSISAGIISSTSNTALTASPKMTLTRAQASLIFMRFMQSYYYGECSHSYLEADCTKGERCSKCNMVTTLPLGHRCDSLSCAASGKCNVCGEIVPADEGLHVYGEASCTAPAVCSICGKTKGKALGHSFSPATCLAPEICTRCNETRGEASGHSTQKGICRYCGTEIFDSEYERIGYHITKNGIRTDKGCYVFGNVENYFDHYGYIAISYYNSINAFVLGYEYTKPSTKETLTLQITIPELSDSYNYTVNYYRNGNLTCSALGSIKPTDITKDYTFEISGFSGDNAYKADISLLAAKAFNESLLQADLMLDGLCGAGVADFNFTNIKWNS